MLSKTAVWETNAFSHNIHPVSVFIAPMILWSALFWPQVFYRTQLLRSLTVAVIWFMAAYAIYFVNMRNPTLGYMVGLLLSWQGVHAINLLVGCNPPVDLAGIHGTDATKDKEDLVSYVNIGLQMQRPSLSFFSNRALRTTDLLLNYRAIGWTHGFTSRRLKTTSHQHSFCPSCGFTTPTLYEGCIRMFMNVLFIICARNWGFPYAKMTLIRPAKVTNDMTLLGRVFERILRTVLCGAAGFSAVDIIFSGYSIVHAFDKLSKSHHSRWLCNPNPWGDWRSVYRNGLAGERYLICDIGDSSILT